MKEWKQLPVSVLRRHHHLSLPLRFLSFHRLASVLLERLPIFVLTRAVYPTLHFFLGFRVILNPFCHRCSVLCICLLTLLEPMCGDMESGEYSISTLRFYVIGKVKVFNIISITGERTTKLEPNGENTNKGIISITASASPMTE